MTGQERRVQPGRPESRPGLHEPDRTVEQTQRALPPEAPGRRRTHDGPGGNSRPVGLRRSSPRRRGRGSRREGLQRRHGPRRCVHLPCTDPRGHRRQHPREWVAVSAAT